MMPLLRTRFFGLALLSMLVAALVAAGAGHRFASADSAALNAYVLAGGDLADLCDETGGAGMAGQTGCPACHIVGTAEVPMPARSIKPSDIAGPW